MRRPFPKTGRTAPLPALAFLAALVLAWQIFDSSSFTPSAQATEFDIEPVVWAFDEDYPGTDPSDGKLNVKTVYVKTHDGADWMSTYDTGALAVSGPDAVGRVVDYYHRRGIQVVAWFVPLNGDIDRQVEMAKAVLDTPGINGLYADIEPFDGFCNWDCTFLAENFWWRLRQERPNARLGVIYDPRPQHWEQSGTQKWLAVADAALPMCYWETFVDQPPWNDPAGCVRQAHTDLQVLAPGRPVEYIPMLQGNSSPERFMQGVAAGLEAGSTRVSVWRRGVVSVGVWNAILGGALPVLPPAPPAVVSSPPFVGPDICPHDGCLLREHSSRQVWVMQRGARFLIPSSETMHAMGYADEQVNAVSDGSLARVPTVLADGTVFGVWGEGGLYAMLGGAAFYLPGPDYLVALNLNSPPVTLPPGGRAQLPTTPRDGATLGEVNSPAVWQIAAGARFLIPDEDLVPGLMGAGQLPEHWTIPDGGLTAIPTTPRDGSLLRELDSPYVYQIVAGARFHVPNPTALGRLVKAGGAANTTFAVSPGALESIPTTPRTGALLRSLNRPTVYVAACGALFHVPDPKTLELLRAARLVEPAVGLLAGRLPASADAPADGCYLMGASGSEQYVICAGEKWHIPDPAVAAAVFPGGSPSGVPAGALRSMRTADHPDACPDTDGDSFADIAERASGTYPVIACGPGAWPPDLDDSGEVDELDLAAMSKIAGSRLGDARYTPRADFNADTVIDVKDLKIVGAHLHERCD